MSKTREEKETLLKLLREKSNRIHYNRIEKFFTDTGITARSKYLKHLECFKAGAEFLERVMFGANRSGKTYSAAYEWVLHATGDYPDWWEGKRYKHAVTLWAIGVDNVQVKDVIQELLLGKPGDFGSGFIPRHKLVGKPTSKAGVAGAVQDVFVRHVSGGISQITFKSYQQDIKSFMGAAIDGIWFDEEPPKDIYDECLLRVLSTKGMILNTFTPLKGFSEVVESFLPNMIFPANHIVTLEGTSKWITRVEWDDVPHLDAETKAKILASISEREKEARSKGIPSLGSSAVFPVSESMILKEMPDLSRLQKVYSICVSWDGVHVLFAAYDKKPDVLYIYDEYRGADMPPAVHKEVINRYGKWQNGTFTFSARRSNKTDLRQMQLTYANLGLNVFPSDFSLRAGILQTYNRMSTNRLKVSANCLEWWGQLRRYAYDEVGNIKGKNANRAKDALMDCTQSLAIHGVGLASFAPDDDDNRRRRRSNVGQGRNSVTGY